MSNFFSSRRFINLAQTHFVESLRNYLWFFCIACILYLVIITPMLFSHVLFEYEMQTVLFYVGLLLSSTVFSMRYFGVLTHRGSALSFYMLPASIFEKFLLAFITIVVLYPLAYTLIFEIITYPFIRSSDSYNRLKIANQILSANQDLDMSYLKNKDFTHFIPFLSEPHYLPNISLTEQLNQRTDSLKWHFYLWSILISIQGFVTSTCLYFKRFPILKTLILGFVLACVTISILVISGIQDDNIQFFSNKLHGIQHRDLLMLWQSIYIFLVLMVIPILLWCSAFFNLQTREVS